MVTNALDWPMTNLLWNLTGIYRSCVFKNCVPFVHVAICVYSKGVLCNMIILCWVIDYIWLPNLGTYPCCNLISMSTAIQFYGFHAYRLRHWILSAWTSRLPSKGSVWQNAIFWLRPWAKHASCFRFWTKTYIIADFQVTVWTCGRDGTHEACGC